MAGSALLSIWSGERPGKVSRPAIGKDDQTTRDLSRQSRNPPLKAFALSPRLAPGGSPSSLSTLPPPITT